MESQFQKLWHYIKTRGLWHSCSSEGIVTMTPFDLYSLWENRQTFWSQWESLTFKFPENNWTTLLKVGPPLNYICSFFITFVQISRQKFILWKIPRSCFYLGQSDVRIAQLWDLSQGEESDKNLINWARISLTSKQTFVCYLSRSPPSPLYSFFVFHFHFNGRSRM